ncbi:MAG: glycerate kinase [Bacteroidales bacterium]|nr:glycerate kinase [Bacteroidales bacterium]
MRILICPDSFKECLSAKQVAEHIAAGIQRIISSAHIKIIPLADGGEGTVSSLVDATGGRIVKVRVNDPLLRMTDSFFGILGDGKTAVIEMAAASGLALLKASERNPWITTTYGTGELIEYALDQGCRKIFVGVGGSATNDGGLGAAKALGIKFFDKDGQEIAPGGGSLGNIADIDISGLDKRIPACKIFVACDVTNPLTGKKGASTVFGPQKGADAAMIKKLDSNLRYYASLIRQITGKDIEHIPGSGAAGGLSAGLLAFANAEIKPGFELVKEVTHLEQWIKWADLVITGEGKIDFQTQYGKTPYGVAMSAKKHGKSVIAIGGTLEKGYEILYKKGFQCIVPVTDKPMDLLSAMKNAGDLIEDTSERILRLLQSGYSLRNIR